MAIVAKNRSGSGDPGVPLTLWNAGCRLHTHRLKAFPLPALRVHSIATTPSPSPNFSLSFLSSIPRTSAGWIPPWLKVWSKLVVGSSRNLLHSLSRGKENCKSLVGRSLWTFWMFLWRFCFLGGRVFFILVGFFFSFQCISDFGRWILVQFFLLLFWFDEFYGFLP